MMSTNHTPGHQSGHLVGCDDLRTWLQSQGFTCERQPVPDRDNLANWYAFRVWNSPTTPQHTVQVRPFKLQLGPRQLESAADDPSASFEALRNLCLAYLKEECLSAGIDCEDVLNPTVSDEERSLGPWGGTCR
jgi:hypothetical protein